MQRALEHYTDLSDIKRIMQQGGGTLNPEFLLSYFGTISRYPSDQARPNPSQPLLVVRRLPGELLNYLFIF